jgi:hypothetical protein
MCVDHYDQAIPSGPFAWKNLPQVVVDRWVTGETFDLFDGHHDGYSRFESPVIHRRQVFWRKGNFWLVRDMAEGSGPHTLELHWHLPPDFRRDGPWFSSPADSSIGILFADGNGTSRLENGFWSPAYGRKEAAPVLSVSTAAKLPQTFVTLLVPRVAVSQEMGLLERLETDTADIDAYRYRTSRAEYLMVFSRGNEPWTVGPCASDAEFLCFGTHQDGGRELMFCNGRGVEIAGKPVVSSVELVQRCELLHGASGTRMFSSAQGGIALQESLGDVSLERAGTTAE